MIISMFPPQKSCFKCIKHIQKLYTVINDSDVDSYKYLWAFIECFKCFFGLQSSLGITNVNRSHNKPLELIETILKLY